MSKDIQKNREALIRYLYGVNHIPQNGSVDCAKCRTLEFLGIEAPYNKFEFVGNDVPIPSEAKERLLFTEQQWHEMEEYFEGWGQFHGSGKRSFSDVANWLQTLPGWPKVL